MNSEHLVERVRRSEMDLAIVTFGCDIYSDEPVRREKLVWVTSMKHSVHLLDMLPIALSHGACEWRHTVLDAFQGTGRKYRIAYSSPNSNAVNAAVSAGLAVGAIPELCVRPSMRILTEKDGFPDLGSFDIGIVRKPGRPSSAANALAQHIAEGLSNVQRPLMAAE